MLLDQMLLDQMLLDESELDEMFLSPYEKRNKTSEFLSSFIPPHLI